MIYRCPVGCGIYFPETGDYPFCPECGSDWELYVSGDGSKKYYDGCVTDAGGGGDFWWALAITILGIAAIVTIMILTLWVLGVYLLYSDSL